jgi:hypothetical protein
MLPYASLLFNHMLTATLLMGSFALLFRSRRPRADLRVVSVAGLLVGLSITSEYLSGVAAMVLWSTRP